MTHVDINGHPTWVHDAGGDGEPLLLLHGGLSNSDAMLETIGGGLSDFRVLAFDRRGHGYTADTEAAFHYADMAAETIGVLERVVGGPAHLVGWSDGGIISLLVALERPDLVRKMVLIGANYHYDGLAPFESEGAASFMEAIGAAYVERSPDGADHLQAVFAKSMAMFASEPTMTTSDLAGIPHPTLVMAGDDDLMTLSHTVSLYESLPNGQLCVIPAASHALPMEQPDRVADAIRRFLVAAEPPQTLMPARRAAPSGNG